MKVSDLRSMPEEELMRRHDSEMLNRSAHYNIYLDELRRREMSRQGERMEALTRSLNRFTRWLVWLTVLIAISTIVSVVIAALTLLSGA